MIVATLIAVSLNSCTASAEVAEVELKYTFGRGGSGFVLHSLLSIVFVGDIWDWQKKLSIELYYDL